ncbi:MAG TPA: tetratricopeptide repeat protein, partial [Candidatus Obscuribacterales bacterium]
MNLPPPDSQMPEGPDSPDARNVRPTPDAPNPPAAQDAASAPGARQAPRALDIASDAGAKGSAAHFTTTWGHRAFVLVGMGFVVFEIAFLTLYGSDFWFDADVSKLGIPSVLAALLVTHFLLTWMESPSGCRFFAPIWKGRPPVVYKKWISQDETGITFGVRHVIWQAIDSVTATFWGNAQVRSRAVCGPAALEADLVLKFPLGVASVAAQKAFVDRLAGEHPGVALNARLHKRVSARDLKGTALVQCLGGAFMFLVLLDVGHSTFTFLQMMKEYYLCQTSARDDDMAAAREHFAAAENILAHPPPFSWVTNKLLKEGVVGAGVQQSRSEALWRLGRRAEALEAARKAVELAPDRFRFNLRLARL